ncbi:hypothetical protein PoB_004326700 [Plakobranchus ocellatus]|uniref:Uncharacterized protein n=1 Tax=Plakobranchus ocellatus TaxID=259542 RepID=A0AAV4BBG2_9GAST|nr:hypothetical protein PoB_004326700 [Plakobranchus ocellatus]
MSFLSQIAAPYKDVMLCLNKRDVMWWNSEAAAHQQIAESVQPDLVETWPRSVCLILLAVDTTCGWYKNRANSRLVLWENTINTF